MISVISVKEGSGSQDVICLNGFLLPYVRPLKRNGIMDSLVQ